MFCLCLKVHLHAGAGALLGIGILSEMIVNFLKKRNVFWIKLFIKHDPTTFLAHLSRRLK